LSVLIQQAIDRPDWKPGNAVAFVISGHGKRVAHSSQFGPTGPRLIIDADMDVSTTEQSPRQSHRYTVRLHFADPRTTKVAGRVFNVSLQDRLVLENFDIVASAGRPRRTIVREFEHIAIADQLIIGLTSQQGHATISGVEILREPD
jgi:hypothetical protein